MFESKRGCKEPERADKGPTLVPPAPSFAKAEMTPLTDMVAAYELKQKRGKGERPSAQKSCKR